MLKALLLLLMNLALAGMATAQNLVPNPSFEDTTYCIGWPPPQVEAQYWYTANTATPDIWNCDLVNPCGYHEMNPDDPSIQLQGYKHAYDGDRFAGGYHWEGPGNSNTREYLTSKLLQPLAAGVLYRVSMYCARPNGVNGAIDHIGVYFGPDSVHAPFPTTLPVVPQARLRSVHEYLEDTAWVELVDTIQATGDEEWMIFGTFENADEVEGIWLGWGSYPPSVYYYIDQLSVEAIVGQSVHPAESRLPLLAVQGGEVVWSDDLEFDELALFDGLGRMIWHEGQLSGKGRFVIPKDLPSGSYIVSGSSEAGRYIVRFVK